MYSSGPDLIGMILGMVFVVIVVAACCSADSGPSNKTSPKRNTTTTKRNVYYDDDSYSECPSCGAPYYDGYCEECGYPDINQGWLGENY